MTLTGTFLIIAGILYAEANKDVHKDIGLVGCTDSDGEVVYGLDGEEIGHADWTAEKTVMTRPAFGDKFEYQPDTYEGAVEALQLCKKDLAKNIQVHEHPAVAEAPPSTSVYPKSKMETGIENTLICCITAFYPPRLNVSWTRNNKVMTQGVSNSQLRVNLNDGSFTMFSTLQFTPHEGDLYTCTVEHSTLERPMTTEFDVEVSKPSLDLGPSVFCGVGLTLGLLGVATGTFFLVKGNHYN
ncbi:H-2 class II histocompatibility antigen, A-Q alpha chain-like [Sardina pilchardus]|uniref:H-2 class II histocompatibility antigen, A-Q alpha chain-like n=1 Tax=Sardina pilchardus TaxID=27697 RepID=UPI002E108B11